MTLSSRLASCYYATMLSIHVRVARVDERRGAPLPLPTYETAGSAGMDLRADISTPIEIPSLGRAVVPTGIALSIPDGYEAQVRPRSGLASRQGIGCLNSPGTIDSDYRGEIQVILVNLSLEPFRVERGDRIAQLVVAPVVRAVLEEVAELDGTARGGQGFGHTGRR